MRSFKRRFAASLFDLGRFREPRPLHQPLTPKELVARILQVAQPWFAEHGFAEGDRGVWSRTRSLLAEDQVGLVFLSKSLPRAQGLTTQLGLQCPSLRRFVDEVIGPRPDGQYQILSLPLTSLPTYGGQGGPWVLWSRSFSPEPVMNLLRETESFGLPFLSRLEAIDDLIYGAEKFGGHLAHAVENRVGLYLLAGRVAAARDLLERLRVKDPELVKAIPVGNAGRLDRLAQSMDRGVAFAMAVQITARK